MKKYIINRIAIVLLMAIGMVACKKDKLVETDRPITFAEGAFIGLDTLKTLYTYNDIELGNNKITGTVISDVNSKNLDTGYVVIESRGYGITLLLSASSAATYAVGDSLVVDVNKAVLTTVLGTTLIKSLGNNQINKVASGKTVVPHTITLGQLSAGFRRYEATLVRVLNTNITPQAITDVTYVGTKSLDDVSGASTVRLYTRASAIFADSLLPSGATFIAIPVFYNTIGEGTSAWAEKRLSIRQLTDVTPVIIVAGWQFGTPASVGNEATFLANTIAPNTNAASLSRGVGYNAVTLARGFSSNAALATISKDDAITNKAYYQFALSAKPGYSLSLAGLTCRLRRSGSGASAYGWMYSFDGVNFTTVGTDQPFAGTDDLGLDQPPLDFSTVAALQNIAPGTTVTFRLYGWGFGNVASGTFSFGRFAAGVKTNLITISGNLK